MQRGESAWPVGELGTGQGWGRGGAGVGQGVGQGQGMDEVANSCMSCE